MKTHFFIRLFRSFFFLTSLIILWPFEGGSSPVLRNTYSLNLHFTLNQLHIITLLTDPSMHNNLIMCFTFIYAYFTGEYFYLLLEYREWSIFTFGPFFLFFWMLSSNKEKYSKCFVYYFEQTSYLVCLETLLEQCLAAWTSLKNVFII